MKDHLDGPAIKDVLGTIGLLAIVGGPLLGVTEQRVLGERIGTLVKWAYPSFFKFYFSLFIIATLMGIYAASVDKNGVAIAMALAAVLVGTGFILWVCYIFLIPGERRERLALTYYGDQLTLFREKNAWRVAGGDSTDQKAARSYLLRSRRLMLKLANALARREAEGRESWTENIRELWMYYAQQCGEAWKYLSAAQLQEAQEFLDATQPQEAQEFLDVTQPQEALTDYCCLLAKEFWELLPRQAGKPLPQLEILPAMLFSYAPSRPLEEGEKRKDRQVEDYLVAGLLSMEAFGQAGEELTWQGPYQILCDFYCGRKEWTKNGRAAFKKLFWGLAWIMVVHSVYEVRANFRFLRELYYRGNMERMTLGEENDVRSFLELFHNFYLRSTRFQDGVSVGGAAPVLYEDKLCDFLLPYLGGSQEILEINLMDDLAVIRKILLEEEI